MFSFFGNKKKKGEAEDKKKISQKDKDKDQIKNSKNKSPKGQTLKSPVSLNNTFEDKGKVLDIQKKVLENMQPDYNFHERVIKDYLVESNLFGSLKESMRSLFAGDSLPKNPYFHVARSLNRHNMQFIFDNYKAKNVNKEFKNEIVVAGKPYAIGSLNQAVFGNKCILELLDYEHVVLLKAAIANLTPDYFQSNFYQANLEVGYSIGGGYLFKSSQMPFPLSAPRSLEICQEVFVECENETHAINAFINFVYEDIRSVTNIQDLHLFQDFIIVEWDANTCQRVKSHYNIETILEDKEGFLYALKLAVAKRNEIFLKLYVKSKMLDYLGAQSDLQVQLNTRDNVSVNESKSKIRQTTKQASSSQNSKYQYIETYKLYNLHYVNATDQKQRESFSHQPLGSLLKRVFINEKFAFQYAALFYAQSQQPKDSKEMQFYVQDAFKYTFCKWAKRSIVGTAWEMLFLILVVENEQAQADLLQGILQIITSHAAQLHAQTKKMQILSAVIKAFKNSSMSFFKNLAVNLFDLYKLETQQLVQQGGDSDVLCIRGHIEHRLKEALDPQNYMLAFNADTQPILTVVQRILKALAKNSEQLMVQFVPTFTDFLVQSLSKNPIYSSKETQLKANYDAFIVKKEKTAAQIIPLAGEKARMKKMSEFKTLSDAQLDIQLLIEYINQYGLMEYLHFFLSEVFFGKLYPNPLPTCSEGFSNQAMRFALLDIAIQDVKSTLFNTPAPEDQIKAQKSIKLENAYQYCTPQMATAKIPTAFCFDRVLMLCSPFELGTLAKLLRAFRWQDCLSKPPPSTYIIQDFLSFSAQNIFNNSVALNTTYAESRLSWDFLFTGQSYQNASQIFIDILVKYAVWLDKAPEVVVIGFFSTNDPQHPFLSMRFLEENLETTRCRDALYDAFYSSSKMIYLKAIFQMEDRFKMVDFYLNMHFIQQKQPLQSLKDKPRVENYMKVFFSADEFVQWSRLFPFDEQQVSTLLSRQIEKHSKRGNLNCQFKLALLRMSLLKQTDQLMQGAKNLFLFSERFYNLARQCDTLYHLVNTIQTSLNYKQHKMTLQNDIQPFFEEIQFSLTYLLNRYELGKMEALALPIFALLEIIKTAFYQEEIQHYAQQGQTQQLQLPFTQQYFDVLKKIALLSQYCLSIHDAIMLSFMQVIGQDSNASFSP